jgi:pilus assembly protein CpaD
MQIEKTTVRGPHRIRPGIAKIIALALLPAALAGCEHDQGTQVAGWTLIDPEQRHPILVSRQPENLTLHIARGSQGLTPMQRARVLEFVSRSRSVDAGNSRFVISAPGGSENESAAREAAAEVQQLMLDGGYSESSIAVGAYQANGGDAPLRAKCSVSQFWLRDPAELCRDGRKSRRSARAEDNDRAQRRSPQRFFR